MIVLEMSSLRLEELAVEKQNLDCGGTDELPLSLILVWIYDENCAELAAGFPCSAALSYVSKCST